MTKSRIIATLLALGITAGAYVAIVDCLPGEIELKVGKKIICYKNKQKYDEAYTKEKVEYEKAKSPLFFYTDQGLIFDAMIQKGMKEKGAMKIKINKNTNLWDEAIKFINKP